MVTLETRNKRDVLIRKVITGDLVLTSAVRGMPLRGWFRKTRGLLPGSFRHLGSRSTMKGARKL